MRRPVPALSLVLALGAAGLAGCGDNNAPRPATDAAADSASSASPAAAAPPVAPTPDPTAAASAPVAEAEGAGAANWRQVASAADASLLGRLDQAWRLGRAEAEDAGFASQVEALGPLVDPNAGRMNRLQPPPGTYRCRTVKLGRRVEGQGLAYVAYPYFACSVELTPGGDLVLTKTTGSQRLRGLLYPEGDRRLVYVGAQAWGDETTYPAYGQNRERDQVGVLERIGDARWRLSIPWPKQEAKLELLEIVR